MRTNSQRILVQSLDCRRHLESSPKSTDQNKRRSIAGKRRETSRAESVVSWGRSLTLGRSGSDVSPFYRSSVEPISTEPEGRFTEELIDINCDMFFIYSGLVSKA